MNSPAQQRAMALMQQKDTIQAEMDKHFAILTQNESTMNSPLLDHDGFPRADIDLVAIRGARVRIIELRNDLKSVMDQIAVALETVYQPSAPSASTASAQNKANVNDATDELTPFALVNAVAPGSPAADAGLKRNDLIVRFGSLGAPSFSGGSLAPLSSLVSEYENRPLPIRVLRPASSESSLQQENAQPTTLSLTLTPRSGWGGRGLLGCHIVPHAS